MVPELTPSVPTRVPWPAKTTSDLRVTRSSDPRPQLPGGLKEKTRSIAR